MPQDATFDRRRFLAKVTALGVAGLVGAGGEHASNLFSEASAGSVRLDRLSADDFAKFLGQTFRIECANGDRLQASLIQVKPQSSSYRRAADVRQPFSVLFRLQGSESLPHQTCLVEHA